MLFGPLVQMARVQYAGGARARSFASVFMPLANCPGGIKKLGLTRWECELLSISGIAIDQRKNWQALRAG